MQPLLGIFGRLANGGRAVVGLVLPVFAEAADFRRWPVRVKVAVGLLLTAVLVGAAHLAQPATGLDHWLGGVGRGFKPYFLATLVLLVVVLAWLLKTLQVLLSQDEGAAEFPDIQAAWAAATERLAAGGLGPADAPLYLVLGHPAAGADALFLAAGVKDIIRAPATEAPPLRVYAWANAIYVTCAGGSAWGEYCRQLDRGADGGWAGAGEPAAGAGEPAARATIGPGALFAGLNPTVRAEMEALMRASTERDLQPDEFDRLRALTEQATEPPPPVRRPFRLPETAQADAVRRVQYLCRLIRRDRRPWCPVNGVLVLVPWAASESDDVARAGSGVLQRDLNAVRAALRQRFPTYAVVCDLETARGFAEFRSGFPPDVLQQRIGQRLPLGPDVEPAAVPGVIADAVRWVGLSVLPAWIHRFLHLGPTAAAAEPAHGSPHNRNLYLLMRAVYDRAPRLAQLLARGVPPVQGAVGDPTAGLPLFGGCYLAGTGRTADGQAFVPGVFERLSEGQNQVSWAPEAVADDTRLNRLATLGYLLIVVLFTLIVAGWWWWWEG